MRIRILALPLLLLAGCATLPEPLRGEYGAQGPREARTGDRVRWGGSVIDVQPQAERTCFQILSRELSATGRPREVDASEGRFLACRAGFYDPAVFTSGREVTVVGTLDGREARTVGEFNLELPRVAADAIHLWPERRTVYYDDRPSWIWWPYGYNGWYGPVIRYHRFPSPRPKAPEPAPSG